MKPERLRDLTVRPNATIRDAMAAVELGAAAIAVVTDESGKLLGVLTDGDIVGLDFGVTVRGMITDSARTIIIGEPRNKREAELVSVTKRAMEAGIETLKDGVRVGDISQAVQQVLDEFHLGNVRDLVGHGVGHLIHEEPNIPNYGTAGFGPTLKAGMTICIEPMSTLGRDDVYIDEDDWTVRTADGTRSAHFEHTILITESGAEILTTI